MHHSTLAARLLAGGLLSLVLTSTAVAELTKDQCRDARLTLGGLVYYQIALCARTDRPPTCFQTVQDGYATWSAALEQRGCPAWPSEYALFANALGAVLLPPRDFYDECSVEAGVCGGFCAESFHRCADVDGECRCVPPPND